MKNTGVQILSLLCLILSFHIKGQVQSYSLDATGVTFSFLETSRVLVTGTAPGTTAGSVHRYNNFAIVQDRTLYALLTVVSTTNATIGTFDDDTAGTGVPLRFQPIISTTGATPGFVTFKISFFDTLTDAPVYLINYNLTAIDVDGSAAVQELYRLPLSEYTSHRRGNTTQITTSTQGTDTQFLGSTTTSTGLNFSNTTSFSANYTLPKTSMTFSIGASSAYANRQASMQLGVLPGTYTTPTVVTNTPSAALSNDLAVTKSVNTTTAGTNNNVVFTITATNNGPAAGTNVSVLDRLPSYYTFVSAAASTGSYNSSTGNWAIGNLANGASATLTLNVKVNSSGFNTNNAGITSDQTETNTANNISGRVRVASLPADADADAIPDDTENSCETEGATPVYINTFGTGARASDTNVLNHTFTTSTSITDGFYGVTTSTGTVETYNQTDLTGNKDAGNPTITGGATTGRYLMINIGPNLLNQPIYRVSSLAVTPGTKYRFRIDMAGLANGAADLPNLQISIKDASNNVLATANSSLLGIANDDVWRRLSLGFVATTSSVTLEIVNLQQNNATGNDIGIDNIILVPLNICDSDADGIENSLDLDSDNDGILDSSECPSVNLVNNGRFTTDLTSWTTTDWFFNAGSVRNNVDGAVNSTLTQSISNLPTGNIVLRLAVGAGDASNAANSSASLQILLNGTLYATISNSLVRDATQPPNVTITMANGASSNFTPYSTAVYTINYYQYFTINIPYAGPSTAPLTFSMTASSPTGDDFILDDISILLNPCDFDTDTTPNYLDVDSDNDGCADAIEGSEQVRYTHIHRLNLLSGDPNYARRGQIKVTYDGVTLGTPAQVISTSPLGNGVPQLVNNAGNNLNPTTNAGDLSGLVDNTDIPTPVTAEVGQGISVSQTVGGIADAECSRCFRPATTTGTTLSTNHGITALNRAGTNNGNWPMKINGAYTVLDAKTKGFVINRLTTLQINALTPVAGMMVYDTDANCLKIYDGTVWSCYTNQTCDNFNL